jgi:hypothetical protein
VVVRYEETAVELELADDAAGPIGVPVRAGALAHE